MNTELKQLSTHLSAMQAKAAATQTELTRSLLIQTIWPSAFESHKPVYSGGVQRMLPHPSRELAFTSFYFRSGDGRRHNLSRDEMAIFQPDAVIHPSFGEA